MSRLRSGSSQEGVDPPGAEPGEPKQSQPKRRRRVISGGTGASTAGRDLGGPSSRKGTGALQGSRNETSSEEEEQESDENDLYGEPDEWFVYSS